MKKFLNLIYFFITVSSLFSVDLTVIEPEELLSVSKGNEINNVSILTHGGNLFPNYFVVDKKGNIYIDDLYSMKEAGVLLFNSSGVFNKRIPVLGKIDGVIKLGLDSDDNLLISDKTKILTVSEGDSLEEVISVSHYTIEPYLSHFESIGNNIIIKGKDNNYKRVGQDPMTIEEKIKRIESFARNQGLSLGLENFETNEETYIDERGFFFSDKIEKMFRVQGDVSSFSYDVPELKSFGIDKDGNTYWYYLSREQLFYSTIFVYDQFGKILIKFDTIEKGDIRSYGFKPFVDYWGNVYVMPVWKEKGVKVFKYERQW